MQTMTAIQEHQDAYLAEFRLREKEFGSEPSWLGEIRRAAVERFADLGFPTTHQEAWKFTNVAPLAGTRFEPAQYQFDRQVAEAVNSLPYTSLDCSRLVFLNGRYCRELSTSLPAGVRAGSLAAALGTDGALAERHLARYANYEDQAFVALNTAFFADGAFVEGAKGVRLDKPLHLLF